MNSLKSILLVLLGGLLALQTSAQFSRGEKKFNSFQYADAIPLFREAIAKDSSNIMAWNRLGDCYRLTNQIDKAEICYSKIAGRPDAPLISKFYYAQMLHTNGKHVRAKFWFKEFLLDDPNDQRSKDFIAAIDNWMLFVADSNRYAVSKININSDDADFGAIPYKDGIIFTSSRLTKKSETKRDSWTGNRFTSMYYAKGSDGMFNEPEIFAKSIQKEFNNGPICFNSNETEMYFTRNNIEVYTDGNTQIDKLKIFSIVLENGNFGKAKAFPYNNDSYSCAHPVLSPDETKLYFSSDMPGGYGGMDLWVCEKVTEGWGAPQNLGPVINTKSNEIFPTFNNDGRLYFSSNGLAGLGGLDIFSTTYEDGTYTTPVNQGAPINSSDDDFSFYYDIKKRSGYFSSNRGHRGDNDDIYAYKSNEKFLSGQIFDKLSNQPLSFALVRLMDGNREFTKVTTDGEGKFSTWVIPGKDYAVIAENSKHKNDTSYVHVDMNSNGEPLTLTMTLNNLLEKNDMFVMKNILYDFNKYDIRADAARELDRVITVLKENPDVRIELSSHTDCRADDNYNLVLSEKRAKAAVKYLVMNGISKKRLVAKGFGKSKLLVNCDCGNTGGSSCSEEDHQANRRTEIKVIE